MARSLVCGMMVVGMMVCIVVVGIVVDGRKLLGMELVGMKFALGLHRCKHQLGLKFKYLCYFFQINPFNYLGWQFLVHLSLWWLWNRICQQYSRPVQLTSYMLFIKKIIKLSNYQNQLYFLFFFLGSLFVVVIITSFLLMQWVSISIFYFITKLIWLRCILLQCKIHNEFTFKTLILFSLHVVRMIDVHMMVVHMDYHTEPL